MTNRFAPSRRSGRFLVWSAVVASCAGCGNAPAPAAASPTSATAPPSVAMAAPSSDTSEVAEPAQLVALVRWKSPQATLDVVSQWLGLHLSAVELAAEAVDRNIAETLRLDAPIDAAAALDPEAGSTDAMPFFAVAVGVRSLEDARRAAGASTEIGPGRYRIRLLKGKRKSDLNYCVLSAAAGPAPARVVCGPRERDVEALSPYLTRTVPRRDLGPSDLHAELRVPPLFSTYGAVLDQGLRMGAAFVPRKLEVGEPAFDRVVGRMALAVTEELGAFAADLDTLTLDLALQPERAHGELAVRFRNQQSWSTGLLANEGSRAAAPPPMFYRLPRQATSASFAVSPEARRFDGIRHALGELVDGWLLHEGLETADRAAVDDLFSDKYTSEGTLVSASGSFEPPVAPPLPDARGKAPASGKAPSSNESGFYMAGIDTPNHAADFIKSFATALARPKIQAYIKSKVALLSDGKPSSKNAPVTMKSVPPAKELPKGSLEYEIVVARDTWEHAPEAKPKQGKGASTAPAPTTLKVHLIVAPTANGPTWTLLGFDRARLVALARATIDGPNDADTLSARPELGALRDDKVVGAGFTSLAAFFDPWTASLSLYGAASRDKLNVLAATPNKGKTPIMVRSRVATSGALAFTADFTLPRGAIEDAVIFATTSSLLGVNGP